MRHNELRQKHFWAEGLSLVIYRSTEICTVWSGLCLGGGRWWHISQRKIWCRGGRKAAKFWNGDALFLGFIQHHHTPSPGTESVSAQGWEGSEDFDFFHYPLCAKPQYLTCCHLPQISLITWGLKQMSSSHLILQKFWNISCFIQHIFSFYRHRLICLFFSCIYVEVTLSI